MSAEFNPVDYWEERHSTLKGDHRNVGNRGLSSEANLRMICSKAVRTANHLGKLGILPGAHVLDAGCGAGTFTGIMSDAGFRMSGVDCSQTAIATAGERLDIDFQRGMLSDFRFDQTFDAVLCLDVLFHIVDVEEWRRSLRNMSAHVGAGGFLVVIEYFEDFGKRTADHVRWRTQRDYDEAFLSLGLEREPALEFSYPNEKRIKTLLTARKR